MSFYTRKLNISETKTIHSNRRQNWRGKKSEESIAKRKIEINNIFNLNLYKIVDHKNSELKNNQVVEYV